MKIQFIASATVLIESKGSSVLCDPWLKDGIYYGSWFHYPPLKYAPEDFFDVDAIYISHIHPDHLDEESLKDFSKNIPILINHYQQKFVLKQIQKLGFQNIYELTTGNIFNIATDFSMEIIPADYCQPQLCQKFLGCMHMQNAQDGFHIDSLCVVKSDGKIIVNVNDCPFLLAQKALAYIKKAYGKIDLLLAGYTGAGPYPQCFANLSLEEKYNRAREKRDSFIKQAKQYIDTLDPKAFFPFAGQYILGGDKAILNDLRGVLEVEELPHAFNDINQQLVLLNSGEYFDLDTQKISSPFIAPSAQKRKDYIQDVLCNKRYSYQINRDMPLASDLISLLRIAQQKMFARQQAVSFSSQRRLYIDMQHDDLVEVFFDKEGIDLVHLENCQPPYVHITLDRRLLYDILTKKAHWNNAEIGSHLTFYRNPDVFERGFYYFLSFLHI